MRCLLIVFSLFITLSVHSQETDTLLSQYPILGYYRLDMTYEEHYNQASKMKEECSMKDSIGIVRHLILINGIKFNMDCTDVSSCHDVRAMDFEQYSSNNSPVFFTGDSYFLDGKLMSITINSLPSDESMMCYMPNFLSTMDLPKNRAVFDISNVALHNKLINQANNLFIYLSEKYGKPIEEYEIKKLSQKQNNTSQKYNAQWYSLCKSGASLPRAKWQSNGMEIVLGISSNGTVSISFLNEKELSYSNLEKYFKPTEREQKITTW